MTDPISNFLMMCKLIDVPKHLIDLEREVVSYDISEPLFWRSRHYLGDQFLEVAAHAQAAAWYVDAHNPDGQPDLAAIVVPAWKRLVDDCPALKRFWIVWEPSEDQPGLLKAS